MSWSGITPFMHYGMVSWHSMPFITIFIETAWNKHLFKIKELWMPFTYVLIYGVVNAIWAWTHKNPIYPVLTWKDWITVPALLGAAGLVIGGSFTAYHGKNKWHKRMARKAERQVGQQNDDLLNM